MATTLHILLLAVLWATIVYYYHVEEFKATAKVYTTPALLITMAYLLRYTL